MKRPLRLIVLTAVFMTAVLSACQKTPVPIGDIYRDRLVINVEEDGIYQISLAELQDAGLSLDSFNFENLTLSQKGMTVPFLIQEDSLIFYGQAPDSRYTGLRPYLLQTGKPGLKMQETAVGETFPTDQFVNQTIHLQENKLYEAQAVTDANPDPWFWAEIGRGGKVDLPVRIDDPGDGSGHLTLQLWGKTYSTEVENDHDLELLVNGKPVETILFDGNVHYLAEVELPPESLQPGENIITLSNEAPGAAFLDIMYLDWLELTVNTTPTAVDDQLTFSVESDTNVALSGFSDKQTILNIQDPNLPVKLSDNTEAINVNEGATVTAVGPKGVKRPFSLTPMRQNDWRNHENRADLIIISTDALLPALEPLIEAREAQGLTVAAVPIAEIYDEFGAGEQAPTAVQAFVTYAAENWQEPKPQYLLLVGEATTDYRGYVHDLPVNHIPSMLVPVAFSGETVSDTRLADIDGDLKPDLAVGRWPVDSVTEVEDLVERTLAYEEGTAVNQMLFATDGSEARFAPMAERLWTDSGLPETAVTHLDGPQAEEVTAAWNEGNWLTTYIGHGSLSLWGKDDIFNIDAVAGLEAGNPPIVVQLTCLTGLFAQPDTESLSEIMIQHENGPVLIVAATSLTLSNHQEPFAIELLKNLNDPAFVRMGDAFQEAKQALDIERNPGLREISDTFVLLGDPSAVIIRPDDK